MKDKKAPKHKNPSTGGGYVRNPDGTLDQVEKSTEPHPGKHEMARREAAKAAASASSSPAKATKANDAKKGNGND